MDRARRDAILSYIAALLALTGVWAKINTVMHGDWLSLGAVLFYIMLFAMFIWRRPSKATVEHPAHYLSALCGTFLPFFTQINHNSPDWLIQASLPIEVLGIGVSAIALSQLGRGFGIFAANREIKTHGLYRWIRHPLYAGEALWFLAIVLQNVSVFNLVLFAVQMGFQVNRIRSEEKLLREDPVYDSYCRQVSYRIVPGVF